MKTQFKGTEGVWYNRGSAIWSRMSMSQKL